jgi:DNA-binding response OmpR family regulator
MSYILVVVMEPEVSPAPLFMAWSTKVRVLVVEDSDLLRDSIAKGLREAGYSVDVAADGENGLWLAKSNDYDVIVLDLMLPKLDGMTLLSELRVQGNSSHVLILTAKDSTEDRIAGLDCGADDYLVKPFSFGELLARVRALVRREYRNKSPTMTLSDLEVDTNNRVVRRGGRPIELTPREYALLEYLTLRAGQVVSRADIWEHLYEFDSTATSNVVDVLVKRLRQKLEAHESPRLIHTKRGFGYLLAEEEA